MPAWPRSTGVGDWVSDHQGVEAPRPQVFTQKDTQYELNFRQHQETARNTGKARRKHRRRGDEEQYDK